MQTRRVPITESQAFLAWLGDHLKHLGKSRWLAEHFPPDDPRTAADQPIPDMLAFARWRAEREGNDAGVELRNRTVVRDV